MQVPVTGRNSNLVPVLSPVTIQLDSNYLCLFLLLLLLPLSLINRHLPRIHSWKKKSFWYAAPFYTSADHCLISLYKKFSKLTFVSLNLYLFLSTGLIPELSNVYLTIFWGGGLFFFSQVVKYPMAAVGLQFISVCVSVSVLRWSWSFEKKIKITA